DGRIRLAWQHAADLLVELVLRQRPPVIRHERKAALEEVLAELLDLLVVEDGGARVFHEDERTLKQRLVRQTDDDILGVGVVRLLRHPRPGELAEADAEVDVGAGIVGVPPALLTPVARELHAAHVEGALEAVRGGIPGRRVAVVAAEDLLRVREARHGAYPGGDEHDDDRNCRPAVHGKALWYCRCSLTAQTGGEHTHDARLRAW